MKLRISRVAGGREHSPRTPLIRTHRSGRERIPIIPIRVPLHTTKARMGQSAPDHRTAIHHPMSVRIPIPLRAPPTTYVRVPTARADVV